MSVQEFHTIFRGEIETYLETLRKKCRVSGQTGPEGAPSPCHSTQSRHASPMESSAAELVELGELKRLATLMVDNIMQRLSDNVASWGLDPGLDETQIGKKVLDSELAQKLHTRSLELEIELQKCREEEALRKAELLQQLQDEYSAILQAHEEELLELRRAAAVRKENHDALEVQQEFAYQAATIQQRLEQTQEAVLLLEDRAKSLDKIMAMQHKEQSDAEAMLASGSRASTITEQDKALTASIRRNEQVCKRLRRHLGA